MRNIVHALMYKYLVLPNTTLVKNSKRVFNKNAYSVTFRTLDRHNIPNMICH